MPDLPEIGSRTGRGTNAGRRLRALEASTPPPTRLCSLEVAVAGSRSPGESRTRARWQEDLLARRGVASGSHRAPYDGHPRRRRPSLIDRVWGSGDWIAAGEIEGADMESQSRFTGCVS